MTEYSEHNPGTFCWVDLSTTDVDGAREFYSTLFGWDYEAMPIDESNYYYMAHIDGKVVAGMGALPPEQQEQGVPTAWTSYVAVTDADAAAEKARSAGATVFMEPMDIFEEGRMSLLADPTGAVFGVWEAGNHFGAELANVPGTLSWNELATRDTAAAREFYTHLFGWSAETSDIGDTPYTSFMNDGRAAGGMLPMGEEWGDTPSHWMVYFAVADCEASTETAESMGATVLVPPTDAPGVGKFSILQDPQGGAFSIIKVDSPPA